MFTLWTGTMMATRARVCHNNMMLSIELHRFDADNDGIEGKRREEETNSWGIYS
jgi:hypothetical protein